MTEQTTWKDPSHRIRLVGDMNRFALRLFEQVCEGTSGNLFLSPSSISTALAMTLAGTAGVTREELVSVLGFTLQEDKLHKAFHDLSECTRTGGVEFRSANRLWGQSNYHFFEDYLQTTQEVFGARLAEVDFKNDAESARSQINAWIAEKTSNRIKDAVPPRCLDSMTRMVLTNAIYFLGDWESPFEEEATNDAEFYSATGETLTVPMMHQIKHFSYGESEQFKVLEMPYKSYGIETRIVDFGGEKHEQECPVEEGGSDFSFMVLLPAPEASTGDVIRFLVNDGIEAMPEQRGREVHVYLPKFRMESNLFLSEILREMGVQAAFSISDADFSRMSGDPEGLFISEVLHKAFVEVNEEGTEAAATTAVFAVGGSAELPPPPVEFRADRPFVFAIRDRATNLIHFIGQYMRPLEE